MRSKPTYVELEQRIQILEKELADHKNRDGSNRLNRQDLEAVLNNTNMPIYLKNADYKYIFMNRQFGDLAHVSYEQVQGKDDFAIFSEPVANLFRSQDEEVVRRQTLVEFEETISLPDGIHTFITAKFPLFDSKDEVRGVGGICTDITERTEAMKALETVHDELEQRIEERTAELKNSHEQLLHSEKLAAIGELSASIAHEFNNPLQGILTVIQGVKRRVTMDAEDAELVDMAIKECDRMKDLINGLQKFNRPSTGKITSMNIHTAIDSLLKLSKKEYNTKNIIVKTHFADNMVQIKAVTDQIKQVILNLLNNAAYACDEGGTITINTELISKENNVTIKVKDSGKSIKPEHMSKIFDPFFTTKPALKGTGLGLSVSYGIIKNHGGRIDVASDPGMGSTFTIVLPIEGVTNA